MVAISQSLLEMIAAEDAREGLKTSKKEIEALRGLTVVASKNPKKPGTQSFDRFQGYFTTGGIGGAVECIQDAYDNGLRSDDIRHDSAHGFIELAA